MTIHHLRETYLGDGLYVSHDNHQIKLRTEREDGDHVVYLDEDVWVALQTYINGLAAAKDPTNGTL